MNGQGPGQQGLPGRWALIRDVLSFAGGWALIFWEARRPEVRLLVMLVGVASTGVPTVAVAAASALDAFSRRQGGTPGSSSVEASGQQQP